MKKIIAAFDGLKLSESALQYAIMLGRQHECHLVGVFLDDLTYTSYALYETFTEREFSYEKLRKLGEKDQATRDAAVWRFEEACDKGIAITELLHESIYADLLVIDVNETLTLVKYDMLADKAAKEQIATLTVTYTDKRSFFIDRLSQGIATIAAAFYPKDVIVRMSDFKTNEYAALTGGKQFEPEEENPMLGFRGASRYYHPLYREGFGLECAAVRTVREDMGLTNVKVMIPFCRTVEEGKKVLAVMKEPGLEQGKDGLEVYVMAEIPSNVLEAEAFAAVFDGFSIGSNDLTQLTLGIDRDSTLVAELFSEQDPASLKMIRLMIERARQAGRHIGLCGQAPSDIPEFAAFLVKQGINSISFNPDALLKGIELINKTEQQLLKTAGNVS